MKKELTLEEQNALRLRVAELSGEWEFERQSDRDAGDGGAYVVFTHPEHGMMRYFPNGSAEDICDRLNVGGIPSLDDSAACFAFRAKFNIGQAIRFVKALSLILGKDDNATSAWEAYCTRDYDKTCLAIFHFLHATPEQQFRAFVAMYDEESKT